MSVATMLKPNAGAYRNRFCLLKALKVHGNIMYRIYKCNLAFFWWGGGGGEGVYNLEGSYQLFM